MEVILFALVSLFHVFICQFTKVEESFNTQAIHDILHFGKNITQYDHLDFPGVVPRTFLCPLLVSVLAYPLTVVVRILSADKLILQIVSRMVISMLSTFAHYQLWKSIRIKFSRQMAFYYIVITSSQFHVAFYSSRTLPNTFALIFTVLSTAFYLRQRYRGFIAISGIVVMIVRSEVALLAGLLLLRVIFRPQLGLRRFFFTAIPTAILALAIIVPIDSFFWRRLAWPEAEVLWFNTVLNRSSEWGTMPALWYFYSALPRCLLATGILVVPALYRPRSEPSQLALSALVFVGIYSLLPHKELRFVLYAVPLLNIAAAHTWTCIQKKAAGCKRWKLANSACCCLLLSNIVCSVLLLTASAHNYPGGEALKRLNSANNGSDPLHIHICNLAAQTGVTKFLHQHDNWIYNKTEQIEKDAHELQNFSHLITEVAGVNILLQNMPSSVRYRKLFVINSFAGISRSWPFYSTKPTLAVLERI